MVHEGLDVKIYQMNIKVIFWLEGYLNTGVKPVEVVIEKVLAQTRLLSGITVARSL
jgi:hypothetical protein